MDCVICKIDIVCEKTFSEHLLSDLHITNKKPRENKIERRYHEHRHEDTMFDSDSDDEEIRYYSIYCKCGKLRDTKYCDEKHDIRLITNELISKIRREKIELIKRKSIKKGVNRCDCGGLISWETRYDKEYKKHLKNERHILYNIKYGGLYQVRKTIKTLNKEDTGLCFLNKKKMEKKLNVYLYPVLSNLVSDYIDYDEKFFLTKTYKKTCKEYLFKILYLDGIKYNLKNYIITHNLIYNAIYNNIFPYFSKIHIHKSNTEDSYRLNEIVRNLIKETEDQINKISL